MENETIEISAEHVIKRFTDIEYEVNNIKADIELLHKAIAMLSNENSLDPGVYRL